MVQDGIYGLGDGCEIADNACEVVSVFRCESLDGGNAGGPESEEGDEDYGTGGEREAFRIMSRGRFRPFSETAAGARNRDRRGIGGGAQCCEIET